MQRRRHAPSKCLVLWSCVVVGCCRPKNLARVSASFVPKPRRALSGEISSSCTHGVRRIAAVASSSQPPRRNSHRHSLTSPARTCQKHGRRRQLSAAASSSSSRLSAVAGTAPVVVSATTTAPIVTAMYMFLLALQFAVQPLVTKTYAPPNISKSTYVLAQEGVRLVLGISLLLLTGTWNVATAGWTAKQAVGVVGVPAVLYLVQNYCSLAAYQNLPPLTYNVLNQTKTVSAAVCCYLLLGLPQSPWQIVALGILILAALVMEGVIVVAVPMRWRGNGRGIIDGDSKTNNKGTSSLSYTTTPQAIAAESSFTASTTSAVKDNNTRTFLLSDEQQQRQQQQRRHYLVGGIAPILTASATSGMAGAWAQKCLVSRNSLLFSVELAVCSMILLLVRSILATTTGTLLLQKNKKQNASTTIATLSSSSWRRGWTWHTWIPVVTNASGGILVGLVTKHAGAVRKGFALILGMFASGLLQNVWASPSSLRVGSSQHGAAAAAGDDDLSSSTSTAATTTTMIVPVVRNMVTRQQWLGGALAGLSLWMHASFPASPRR
jgi:solute carrier family 35 (UDP-sugar transporter), member A1/2/3